MSEIDYLMIVFLRKFSEYQSSILRHLSVVTFYYTSGVTHFNSFLNETVAIKKQYEKINSVMQNSSIFNFVYKKSSFNMKLL